MGIIGKIEDKLHMGGHKSSSTSHAPTHGAHTTSDNLKGPAAVSASEGTRSQPIGGLGAGKDRDHDGIPDALEGRRGAGKPGDRDGDGIPDALEGRSGTRGIGTRGDRDGDGIPDKLEGRSHGLNKDRNHDGIPDNLQGGIRTRGDRDGDGIPDALEGRGGTESYNRLHHAPVVKETVRDEYQHNVQPVIQEEHDRTDIIKTVQPLKDSQVDDTQVHNKQRTDQFREVGMDARLAAETEEKLRLHRREVEQQGGRVHLGDTHEFTENAPQVSHTERRHVVEEVQPVVERDVLRPHVVEEKQNIFVHHKEAPELKEVRVAPVMSVQEWERTQASKGERITGDTALHHQRTATDRDGDGIPDRLEGRTGTVGGLGANRDRDGDGIPDRLEGRTGVTGTHGGLGANRDRDGDGIPDRLEGRGGTTGYGNTAGGMRDRDHDGIPDSQEKKGLMGKIAEKLPGNKDSDHDGIPDRKERGDVNRDGIPDSKQRNV
jgi:hypothetical protein